jgi:hypothetical protein
MRRAALPGCDINQDLAVLPMPNGNWGKAHQAAIAGCAGISGARDWFSGLLKSGERLASGDPDIKATSGAGIIAARLPADKPHHKVAFIELGLSKKAVHERESHGGIIGPFARF